MEQIAIREAALKAARAAEAQRQREQEAAELAAREEEARHERRREAERRAAELQRAEDERTRARVAAQERERAEQFARAEAERVQAEVLYELAMRAAVWPGASKAEAEAAAESLIERLSHLSDQFVADLGQARFEAASTDVGKAAAEVAGGIAAVATILGRAHPLLGLAGLVVAAGAAPVAGAIKSSRNDHYRRRWEAALASLRPPEKELLAAVLQYRHPALAHELLRALA